MVLLEQLLMPLTKSYGYLCTLICVSSTLDKEIAFPPKWDKPHQVVVILRAKVARKLPVRPFPISICLVP